MKNTVTPYLKSILVLLAATLLFSLFCALLYWFNFLSTKSFALLSGILGVLAYAFAGWCLGKQIQKNAIMNALLVCVLFLAVFLLLPNKKSLAVIAGFVCKLLAYVGTSVLALNTKS